jgi:hypothetical protein
MNHFKCPHNPFTCDYSEFWENIESSGKIKRWVECADYVFLGNPFKRKMEWMKYEEFKLVVDNMKIVIKKGDLCVNNPSDWREVYESLKE